MIGKIQARHEERHRMRERIDTLHHALQQLYDETADYIRLNHLGDVHHNQSMKDARDALENKLPSVPATGKPIPQSEIDQKI